MYTVHVLPLPAWAIYIEACLLASLLEALSNLKTTGLHYDNRKIFVIFIRGVLSNVSLQV